MITGIYKIISPSGKIYIGQAFDIYERWYIYKTLKCKKQPKLYNSLKKYGWDNHQKEILEECSIEYLDELETWWKLFYNSVEDGLNCQYWDKIPNRGKKFTKKHISKMKLFSKGHKINLGRVQSDETKQKIGLKNKGKIRSEEYKQKRKGINKGNKFALGNKLSEETCQKISESKIGHDCYKNPERGRKISETKRLKKLLNATT